MPRSFIKKNGVIRYSLFPKQSNQFRPDCIMSSFVFFLHPREEVHPESQTFHNRQMVTEFTDIFSIFDEIRMNGI
jgi:hypothetical protein